MNPTKEQIAINALVADRNDVIISAGAGTGKSSTLRFIAQQNSNLNFLVLCFNAANATESNEHPDRPSNIWYSTLHAIAYKEFVCKDMRKKLKPYLNYKDIDDRIFLDNGLCDMAVDAKDEKRIIIALRRGMQDAIVSYCRSDSRDLLDHASKRYHYFFSSEMVNFNNDEDVELETETVYLTEVQQHRLAELTRKYWLTMIDTGSDYSITHDVYLKLFHLRGNKIGYYYDKERKQEFQLDCLMLDEAQDTNPVAAAIYDASGLQKVLVGDSMQQLYAWRGAGDCMEHYPHFKHGTLSTSFRFNSEIARMANVVLAGAGSSMKLTGAGTHTSKVTQAHLCRTNVSVIRRIFAEIKYNENIVINTNIDLKELCSKLYHINAVYFGQVPKFPNKTLKDLLTKDALEEALAANDDLKQLQKIAMEISDNNGGSLFTGIKKMQEHIVNDGSGSLTISTIHRSKGLEYSSVTIDDDIVRIRVDGEGAYLNLEEALSNFWSDISLNCLLYVAITRAKVEVKLPKILLSYFT